MATEPLQVCGDEQTPTNPLDQALAAKQRLRRNFFLILALVCLATVTYTRLRYLTSNFGNFDVAGIVYNADLILDGDLPYRDSFEMKSPFLFFLFAGIFWLFESSLLWVRLVWGLWLLASGLVLFSTCRRLGSTVAGGVAAFLLTLHGALYDINYASWLVLPLTLAVYAFVRAWRGSWIWYSVCGMGCAFAFLVKKPGGFVVLVFLALIALRFREGFTTARLRAALRDGGLILAGSLLFLAPLLLLYAVQGELGALLNGLFPGAVIEGVLKAKGAEGDGLLIFENMGRGIVQVFVLFPLATAMAVITCLRMIYERSLLGRLGTLAVTWFAVSFFSVAITGGRFYQHHCILYLPALSMLAAHPKGLLSFFTAPPHRARVWKIGAWIAGLAIALSGTWVAYQRIITDLRGRYDWPAVIGEAEPQKTIGEYIRTHTVPSDTIIAWGWFSWPVYHWSQRRSPSPIYKEMGILTDVNTNSSWSPSREIHFRPGPISDDYLRAVKRNPPKFIVISDWYPFVSDSQTEPLLEFTGLHDFIEAHYRLHKNYAGFKILALSEESAADPPDPGPE